ncbi:MAG: DinB family protein [Bryobacteraceae bacterium]
MEVSEREFLRESLFNNRERLLNAVTGLTAAQTEFRPGPNAWSIPDCLEHITLVETRVMKSIERVLQTAPEPQKAATVVGKERLILAAVPDRSTKVEAPEQVRPTRQSSDIRKLTAAFQAARERSMRFAAESDADLRSHFFPHIRFGDLDCYQWLVFLGPHCERHVLQIEEIKAAGVGVAK